MNSERDSAETQVARLQVLLRKMRKRVEFVEASRFWKLRGAWFAAKGRLGFNHDPAPPAIPAVECVEAIDATDPYAQWLIEHDPREADLDRLRQIVGLLPRAPTVDVIADAAGDAAELNAALQRSPAEIVVVLEPHHLLASDALFEVAIALNEQPDAEMVYGDWDTIDASGRRFAPRFLPDWSPEAFLSQMYTGTPIFYRRQAVLDAGGFRHGFGTAIHYDVALRVAERAKKIEHRSRIFYHSLRANGTVTSIRREDAEKAILAALERRGERGRVEQVAGSGAHVVRYALERPGRVDILIPTRDRASDLERCLTSLFELTTYHDYRVTVVDNQSEEKATAELLAAWREREPARFAVVRFDEPFNFSRCVNAAARATDGSYIVLLNNDTQVISRDWLEAMLDQAQREPIGAVGARLLYPDGSIQHAGVVLPQGSLPGHIQRHAAADTACAVRNYSALTAACLMLRRDAFEAIDGFNEELCVEYGDIDFCLRLREAGYRNVYLPHVVLHHVEKASRNAFDSPMRRFGTYQDRCRFQDRWSSYCDPYFNQHFALVYGAPN